MELLQRERLELGGQPGLPIAPAGQLVQQAHRDGSRWTGDGSEHRSDRVHSTVEAQLRQQVDDRIGQVEPPRPAAPGPAAQLTANRVSRADLDPDRADLLPE
jgi:hypothetical protein